MDNKIKVVFLDVDGTLISFENHKIPRSAIDALTLAHQNGVRLVIATGRVWTDLRDLEEIPYDAVVSLNGAQCVLRDGTEISAKQIAWEDYVKVRDFADINVSGVDKAVGMKDIADYYGFDMAETMAFGDGANDIPMLRSAGIGIAMGTAADSVKIHADYVTGSVDEDGIRSALLHFGLI